MPNYWCCIGDVTSLHRDVLFSRWEVDMFDVMDYLRNYKFVLIEVWFEILPRICLIMEVVFIYLPVSILLQLCNPFVSSADYVI
jgi:hypothetical protein